MRGKSDITQSEQHIKIESSKLDLKNTDKNIKVELRTNKEEQVEEQKHSVSKVVYAIVQA